MDRLTPDTPVCEVVQRVARRYARRCRMEVEDLAQECWLAILQAPGRPNYFAASNACIRAARRSIWHFKRDRLRSSCRSREPIPDEVLDVPYLLAHLTQRQWEVVYLTYWEGLSGKAIGERLGIHWTTVATLRRNALARLRAKYSDAHRRGMPSD